MGWIDAMVTSKGQVTVPVVLRRALGLKTGDRLVFTQDANGRSFIDARTDALADLRGVVTAEREMPPVDGTQVEGWIREGRAARWIRGRAEDESGAA